MADKGNNVLLFMFGIIFITLGVVAPFVNEEFNTGLTEYDTGIIDDVGQEDISSTNAISILGAVFFWVFGAPVWLNIILTMMRVVFWIIVYDKIRGI